VLLYPVGNSGCSLLLGIPQAIINTGAHVQQKKVVLKVSYNGAVQMFVGPPYGGALF
jgi:hypothetical protein